MFSNIFLRVSFFQIYCVCFAFIYIVCISFIFSCLSFGLLWFEHLFVFTSFSNIFLVFLCLHSAYCCASFVYKYLFLLLSFSNVFFFACFILNYFAFCTVLFVSFLISFSVCLLLFSFLCFHCFQKSF